MANLISLSSQCQGSSDAVRTINCQLEVDSAALDANVLAFSHYNEDIVPYVFTGVQPTPADAGANIPTLGNGLNSTIGIVAYCQDAAQLLKVELYPLTIVNTGLGGTLTSGVVVSADLGGAASTGVSISKNICFRLGLNGLTLNAGAGTHIFNLAITYKVNLNV